MKFRNNDSARHIYPKAVQVAVVVVTLFENPARLVLGHTPLDDRGTSDSAANPVGIACLWKRVVCGFCNRGVTSFP